MRVESLSSLSLSLKSCIMALMCGTLLIAVVIWLESGQVLGIFGFWLLLSYFFRLISFGRQQENVCSLLLYTNDLIDWTWG